MHKPKQRFKSLPLPHFSAHVRRGSGHRQTSIFKPQSKHRDCHGGRLRNLRLGRKARALSKSEPLHLVLKADREILPGRSFLKPRNLRIVYEVLRQYSKRFFVRIEQVSVNGDHIHILTRCSKRHLYQSFFKVLSGQIAQRVTATFSEGKSGRSLWRYRPYTRIVRGFRAYKIVRNYIKLNEREARGEVPYRKERLRGLTAEHMRSLWTGEGLDMWWDMRHLESS